MDAQKVSVYFDNSNIFKRIQAIRKEDPSWNSFYDPYESAKILVGNRQLVSIFFYCVHPPAYLLEEDDWHKAIHARTSRYYAAIEKLPLVTVKYGYHQGPKSNLQEKNVDTQLSLDVAMGAAMGHFDTGIIVASDGDYVGAVESAKKFGKKIEIVFFRGALSMNLGKACDVKRAARCSYFPPLDFKKT